MDVKIIKQQRIASFDMLKGFAIFMVVAGHVIQYLISGDYSDQIGYRLIYSFHMPLFMAITGFFVGLGGEVRYLNVRVLLKRIKYLLTPLVVWALVTQFVLEEGELLSLLLRGLWFLKSAACCTLLYIFCYWLPVKRRWIPLVISVLLSPAYMIFMMKQMYPCFVAGAFWFRANIRRVALISGGVWLMMVPFFSSYFWSGRSLVAEGLGNIDFYICLNILFIWAYRLILGLSGSLMFLCLFEYLANIKFDGRLVGRLLNKIGKETLWIYVIQSVVLELYMGRYVNIDILPRWVFYFVAVPVISMAVITVCMGIISLSKAILRNTIFAVFRQA